MKKVVEVKVPSWLAKKRGTGILLKGTIEAETQKAVLLEGKTVSQKSINCLRCGRELTHPSSKLVGFGPTCCEKLGVEWPDKEELSDSEIAAVKEKIEKDFKEWLPKSQIELEVIENKVKPAKIGMHARELKSGEIKIKGVGIKSPYEHKNLCKKLQAEFGGRWNAKKKMWIFPLQTDVVEYAEKLWKKEGHQTERTPMLQGWYEKEKQKQAHLISAKAVEDISVDELDTELAETLYDFQRAGAHFLSQTDGAILADDMGLGKTIQTLAAIDMNQNFPALIICPASIKENWRNEIEKWLDGYSITILKGSKEQRLEALQEPADFYIGNYALLREESRAKIDGEWTKIDNPIFQEINSRKWGAIVFDEAHKIKNRKSQQTQGAHKAIKSAEKVYHLTGTPIMNAPEEIWSLLHSLDEQKFSSFWRFVKRHCHLHDNGWGTEIRGVKNPKEFRKVLEPYMLRRVKEEVLEDLPSLTIQKQWVELEGKQKKIYDQMEKRMIAEISEQEKVAAPVIIAKITRLKQIAVSPSLISKEGKKFQSAKIDALMDILEGAGEQKVVIFSQFKKAISLVEKELKKKGWEYGIMTGNIDQNQRQKEVDKFQNDSDCKIFLATIKAGGLGINLTAGSIAVFLDKDWTPANNSQAVDRLHRIGQENNVTVIELLAKNSIEDYIEKVLEEKQETFDTLIEGKISGKELLMNMGIGGA